MRKTLIILLIGIMLTGCKKSEFPEEERQPKRFAFYEDEGDFCIYVDRETSVMYAVSDAAYNCGTVTLLVDEEGKPLIYKGD